MAIEPGTRFREYAVVEQIGSGGMGEVWRATDTELGRDVAIKALPPAFVDDADRLARLKREAELLAALNHPNIATIHGMERVDDRAVIVMELVEGPTLADRIMNGPMPPDEAMAIALQIAAALEAAHGKQIVHRDLKPANVKIRDDGTVKLLDFGISKPIDASAISGRPVMTTPAVTETGIIMGTASYMSPEQAQGKFVDQRTDIWAFGCLLFEMLTGQPAFGGENVMAIIARVIDRDIDLSALPRTISPAVRHALELCLEKDPRKRIADIRDVRLALEGRLWPSAPPAAPRVPVLPWALTFLALVAAGAALFYAMFVDPAAQPGAVVRTVVLVDPPTIPGLEISLVRDITIAPDESLIVYGSGARSGQLFMRPQDSLESEPLPGTDGGSSPVISSDGRRIAFFVQSEGALKTRPVSGGAATTIARVEGEPAGLSWGPNDTIVFATDSSEGLMQVAAAEGSEPERLTASDDGRGVTDHRWPSMLRDGRGVLFTVWRGTAEQSTLAVFLFATKKAIDLPLNGTFPVHAPTGHLLYALGDSLRAVTFDAERPEVTSEGSTVVVDSLQIQSTGAAQFDVSSSGALVYLADASPQDTAQGTASQLMRVDRTGMAELIALPPQPYRHVRISPNGARIVASTSDTIWVSDSRMTRLSELPLAPSVTGGWWSLWSPDSERVVFQNAGGTGLLAAFADDGSRVDTLITGLRGPIADPNSWTPDGRLLFTYGAIGESRIGMLDVESRTWEPFIDRGRPVMNAAISPLGDWLAFEDTQSRTIYIERYPELGDRHVITGDAGGMHPAWSPDAREIYYIRPDGFMMAVPVASTPTGLDPGTPVELFPTTGYFFWGSRNWDVGADGRFLMPRLVDSQPTGAQVAQIVKVQNWLYELERLVPPR